MARLGDPISVALFSVSKEAQAKFCDVFSEALVHMDTENDPALKSVNIFKTITQTHAETQTYHSFGIWDDKDAMKNQLGEVMKKIITLCSGPPQRSIGVIGLLFLSPDSQDAKTMFATIHTLTLKPDGEAGFDSVFGAVVSSGQLNQLKGLNRLISFKSEQDGTMVVVSEYAGPQLAILAAGLFMQILDGVSPYVAEPAHENITLRMGNVV